MKLKIIDNFTLEVGEDVYVGSFSDLTKKQEKEITKTFDKQKKNIDKINELFQKKRRVERKILVFEKNNNWDDVSLSEKKIDSINKDIEGLTVLIGDTPEIEEMFKKRLEISLSGDDAATIMDIAKKYGYERVFKTIIEDIKETRTKN